LELELHRHVRHVWRARQVDRNFEIPGFVAALFEVIALPLHATGRARDGARAQGNQTQKEDEQSAN